MDGLAIDSTDLPTWARLTEVYRELIEAREVI